MTRIFASASLFALFSICAIAQTPGWPARTVRVIAPFAAGGTADLLGRITAGKLSESFGQSFIVENRAGAGGVLGSELVARSAPDGYTLLVSGVASHAIAPALSPKFPFDPVKDFAHIALFGGPRASSRGNLDPKAFTEFVAAEVKRWAPVVKASGARTD